jgi:hypothetical protein
MVMRALPHQSRRIHLLQPPQIHRLLQQRQHIRIKRLPVRVVEVVLLGLNQIASAPRQTKPPQFDYNRNFPIKSLFE